MGFETRQGNSRVHMLNHCTKMLGPHGRENIILPPCLRFPYLLVIYTVCGKVVGDKGMHGRGVQREGNSNAVNYSGDYFMVLYLLLVYVVGGRKENIYLDSDK